MSQLCPSPLKSIDNWHGIKQLKGLNTSAFALFLSQQATHNRIIITATTQEAHWLYDALNTWCTDQKVLLIPDYETLPFDRYAPSSSSISDRMKTLYQINTQDIPNLMVVSLKTWVCRTYTPEFLHKHACIIHRGDHIDPRQFVSTLTNAGYNRVNQVQENGDVAVNGSIIDLFPNGSPQPYRIDFFDQDIDCIHRLDLKTNGLLESVDSITVLPANEFDLNSLTDSQYDAIAQYLHQHQVDKIRAKQSFEGIHNWLPLLHERMGLIKDFLPHDTQIFVLGNPSMSLGVLYEMIGHRHQNSGHPMALEQLFLPLKEAEQSMAQGIHIPLKPPSTNDPIAPFAAWSHQATREEIEQCLIELIQSYSILIIVSNEEKHLRLNRWLADFHQPWPLISPDVFLQKPKYGCALGHLKSSFILKKQRMIILRLDDLMPQSTVPKSQSKKTIHDALSLNDLKPQQMVVHQEHGIGLFQGTENIKDQEFLVIEYAKAQKLFLAIHEVHKLSQYFGSKEHTKIDQLGKPDWKKRCDKAKSDIDRFASGLIEQYAKRSIIEHKPYTISDRFTQFSQSFLHQETLINNKQSKTSFKT